MFGFGAAFSVSAQTPSGAVEDSVGCPSLIGVQKWAAANIRNYDGDYSAFCGDFTGDGAKDVFAVIRSPTGGNSSYQDAVLFQNAGGQLRFLRKVPQFFGDTKRAAFAPGKVTLELTVMRPGDPRCCPSGTERREVDVATGRHAAITKAGAAKNGNPNDVTVSVQFSARAATLAARKTMTLQIGWSGEPLPAKRAAALQAGIIGEETSILLGMANKAIPGKAGQYTLAPETFESRYASWVRQVDVSANIDMTNAPSIRCSDVMVPIAVARAKPLIVTCKMTGER